MQIRNLGNSNASPLRYYWCVVGLLKLHQRYFGAQRLVFAVVSSVSSARLFMLNLTIFTWHSVWTVHGCVHVFHLKIHLMVRAWLWRYTDTLFADKYTPTCWILLTSFFCGQTYINFLIAFTVPFLLKWTPYHLNI